MPLKRVSLRATLILAVLLLPVFQASAYGRKGMERQHLVFFQGTPLEMEVYKNPGRLPGPTVMILGGIHGDEQGTALSADGYVDLPLKRGNLIVVPRANFSSIIRNHRGFGGDMNRKFGVKHPGDPESQVVAVLKSLMAESDVLLTLHDGSGFYRPDRESDMAGPHRYGQSVIADADIYTHPETGAVVKLQASAEAVLERVNKEISNPLYRFHFFNMRTFSSDSRHKEHRNSATFYALSRFGIPAFCIETSKQLPSLEMKVYQHNLMVNAFLARYGVEPDPAGVRTEQPMFSHVVVTVNRTLPLAVSSGQTLLVSPGDTVEVIHVSANFQRGVSVGAEGSDGENDLFRPITVEKPVSLMVRKDQRVVGGIRIGLLPTDRQGGLPELQGRSEILPLRPLAAATLDMLPGTVRVAEVETGTSRGTAPEARPAPPPSRTDLPVGGEPASITGFLVEVDGQRREIRPGGELVVLSGALVKMVALRAEGGGPPRDVTMNFKGFVPGDRERGNTGEDRGVVADTARDMRPAFSRNREGKIYAINAERGKTVLASCSLKIVDLKLVSVTVRIDGKTKVLRRGSRTPIAVGAQVELLDIELEDGRALEKPRLTLGGHAFPPTLPRTLVMRDIAINLAVFDGERLAGKITWVPAKR